MSNSHHCLTLQHLQDIWTHFIIEKAHKSVVVKSFSQNCGNTLHKFAVVGKIIGWHVCHLRSLNELFDDAILEG
jgi:hypothetical protein